MSDTRNDQVNAELLSWDVFEALDKKTARELYDKMLEIYPNRINPTWALWSSARAVKR